jgi:dihydrofolate reductase
MPSLSIIVATDKQGGIGIDNKLPWHLPEDLAHFKRTTSGHAIIMGRKTFDSIGRPLPNRHNIVVSRDTQWHHDGVDAVTSLDAAIGLLKGERAYIIGGAQIYTLALPFADQLIVTEIQHSFNCDAFFTTINPIQWEEVGRETFYSEANQFNYAFVTYKKR